MRREKSSSWMIWSFIVVMAIVIFFLFSGCGYYPIEKTTTTTIYKDSNVVVTKEKLIENYNYGSSYYNSYP